MRYVALATDYDGTLASHGKVAEETLEVLRRVLASGRKLLLVTGRHLPDLHDVFPQLDLFQSIVAENGALLYRPATRQERLLCEPPPEAFLRALSDNNVPFSAGRGIVATWEPHQDEVLKVIRDLGLELQVIFNKGAVMVLPTGVNKGTGLKAAVTELGVSLHNVVGLGDAENDHALLAACECGVAVANALPFLKERADIVTEGRNGAGVAEIAEKLLADDLAGFDGKLKRHFVVLGRRLEDSNQDLRISPSRNSILVTGPSASGKSTVVAGLVEQIAAQEYQFCLVDPEGDYEDFADALTLGTAKERPDVRAVLKALESPHQNIVVSLLGIPVAERPQFFSDLLTGIQDLRARTARPHWLIVDEAHHLLPASWSPASTTVPQALAGTILITVHPDHVSSAALKPVNVVIAVGKSPMRSFRSFADARHITAPSGGDTELRTGEALVWFQQDSVPPVHVRTVPGTQDRKRHLRLYAQGELSPEQSFYIRGPGQKLNLRAQNLVMFLQLADGVDDETWNYHLRNGDYSRWLQKVVKDGDLADIVSRIEQDQRLLAKDSRSRVREIIESRYTAPS
jgi:hydroxymethylpyrimidine pyrophosphatase-like HAD family hydrolase